MMIPSDLTPCWYLLQPSILRSWRKPVEGMGRGDWGEAIPRWASKKSLEIFKQRRQSFKLQKSCICLYLFLINQKVINMKITLVGTCWNLQLIKTPSEPLCGWPRSSCTTHHAQHDLIETPWSHFWQFSPVWKWEFPAKTDTLSWERSHIPFLKALLKMMFNSFSSGGICYRVLTLIPFPKDFHCANPWWIDEFARDLAAQHDPTKSASANWLSYPKNKNAVKEYQNICLQQFSSICHLQ